VLDERRLQRVQVLVGEPFDRGDLDAVERGSRSSSWRSPLICTVVTLTELP
jgi:hypothetical protein